MTATLRTQRARSRQAQSGAKRVEVVLDAGNQKHLAIIRDEYGCTNGEAVRLALSSLCGRVMAERHPEGF